MNKKIKIVIVIAVVVLAVISLIAPYNGMVRREEDCTNAWSNVENVYQRRMDLIPNLIKTVQGAANYEKGTLESVIEARSKASSIQVDANNLSETSVAKFQAAQEQLSGALSKMLITIERYPELKANQNFVELQAQLEGTENRIAVERNAFNKSVKQYNTYIRKFPNNIVAGIFNFEKKGYFHANEGAEKAPEVNFDFE